MVRAGDRRLRVLGIDPGNTQSGWCLVGPDGRVEGCGVNANEALLLTLLLKGEPGVMAADLLAVEMIASYGMPVGREVFDTCVWIGRFVQASSIPHRLVYRGEVKSYLCHSQRATDANIRAALIDCFGPGRENAIGVKRAPGPLYGVKSHAWAALAVAVTAQDTAQVNAAAESPRAVEGA